MVTPFDTLKTINILEWFCKQVKTRGFEITQTPSILARRLSTDPNLPKPQRLKKWFITSSKGHLSKANGLKDDPSLSKAPASRK